MFSKLLIANRGEIALRIQRACRRLGIKTVCVFSEADRDAPYLQSCDEAICIGPASVKRSYLNQSAILLAAELTGAEAIHPGYGFLSESPGFARAVQAAGFTFIGPSAESIERLGDKVSAKRTMMASGVPCVPGPVESLPADHAAIEAIADAVGYPLILKAAGGGGGRGMRVAHGPHELAEMVTATREEADRYFGNPDVYVEKFLEKPRHIEIQVICDGHGRALWLGDRDCSVQRRHQKIIEEGPAPGIDRSAIETVGEQCVEACRRIGYVGAGTFEFLYQDGAFHFIEMNTRVQVEHPVTETVTGLDIVAMQIVAAAGERFTLCQSDVGGAGHAIECRINAEDPFTFRPAPGPIGSLRLPGGPGVRVDTHIVAGYVVPGHYDSMIAKLIVHGRDRADALGRMRAALGEMEIGGTTTNLALHRILMDDPQFAAGGVDIHFLETWLEKRARQ